MDSNRIFLPQAGFLSRTKSNGAPLGPVVKAHGSEKQVRSVCKVNPCDNVTSQQNCSKKTVARPRGVGIIKSAGDSHTANNLLKKSAPRSYNTFKGEAVWGFSTAVEKPVCKLAPPPALCSGVQAVPALHRRGPPAPLGAQESEEPLASHGLLRRPGGRQGVRCHAKRLE